MEYQKKTCPRCGARAEKRRGHVRVRAGHAAGERGAGFLFSGINIGRIGKKIRLKEYHFPEIYVIIV